MWTVLWTEDGNDKWDRFATEDEVRELIDDVTTNNNVVDSDIWIFPPEADDLSLTGDLL